MSLIRWALWALGIAPPPTINPYIMND